MFNENMSDFLPPIGEEELSDLQVLDEIARLKERLKDQVIVLGHHYQQDDIIRFADVTGDSLALAQKAILKEYYRPYILFCGVHFMAETADILGQNQTVILPDPKAGCSMADMAKACDVERAWEEITSYTHEKIIPVTYVNSSAAIKAFVGEHDGLVCTSGNAQKIIKAAFERGEKLFFFPDQHLGRNTCYKMGIPLTQMSIYDPRRRGGGVNKEQIAQSKVILWYGYCSVHQGFTPLHIEAIRAKSPQTHIIVHPECDFEVVQKADDAGSTQYIIEKISKSPKGSSFAVGTEVNLVNRLAHKFPDHHIVSLSPYQCLCTTMYRIRPRWLLESFRSIERGQPQNVIKVPTPIKEKALLALNRMMELS